jgi:hypothetical protein
MCLLWGGVWGRIVEVAVGRAAKPSAKGVSVGPGVGCGRVPPPQRPLHPSIQSPRPTQPPKRRMGHLMHPAFFSLKLCDCSLSADRTPSGIQVGADVGHRALRTCACCKTQASSTEARLPLGPAHQKSPLTGSQRQCAAVALGVLADSWLRCTSGALHGVAPTTGTAPAGQVRRSPLPADAAGRRACDEVM